MTKSVLEVAEAVCQRIGLPRPFSVVGATSGLPPQYLSLMHQAAGDIVIFHDWQALVEDHSFTSIAAELQFTIFTALPDFKRIDPDTVINTTRGYTMRHMNSRANANIRLTPSPQPWGRYRLKAGKFLLPGNTTAGDTIQFEYVSNGWLLDADTGDRKMTATKNTDIVMLDEEALIRGTKWLFKKEKGLSYGEDFNDWLRYLKNLKENDTPKEDLSLNTPGVASGASFPSLEIPTD